MRQLFNNDGLDGALTAARHKSRATGAGVAVAQAVDRKVDIS
ncbi:hypothetical protein [Pseudomonas sp. dw_358]|nr:hypothetical protein [Pseudomonas sp. dw_358]